MNQLTEQLVRRAQRGDAHAFSRLYETVYQDLYRFAVYTLRHPQDAEDAVSETVTDAFAQIRILSNKCKRRIRQYVNPPSELDEGIPAGGADLHEMLDVRRAFSLLPDEDRLILSMNLFAGYTSQEIGDFLGVNASTVRSRQSRALKKMQAHLS